LPAPRELVHLSGVVEQRVGGVEEGACLGHAIEQGGRVFAVRGVLAEIGQHITPGHLPERIPGFRAMIGGEAPEAC